MSISLAPAQQKTHMLSNGNHLSAPTALLKVAEAALQSTFTLMMGHTMLQSNIFA